MGMKRVMGKATSVKPATMRTMSTPQDSPGTVAAGVATAAVKPGRAL